jgi:hypothetical protein
MAGGDTEKVGWPQLCKEDICYMQDAEELLRNVQKQQKEVKLQALRRARGGR